MKTLKEILFVTELPEENKWILSWKSPDFQVSEEYLSQEISKEEAEQIIKLINLN